MEAVASVTGTFGYHLGRTWSARRRLSLGDGVKPGRGDPHALDSLFSEREKKKVFNLLVQSLSRKLPISGMGMVFKELRRAVGGVVSRLTYIQSVHRACCSSFLKLALDEVGVSVRSHLMR